MIAAPLLPIALLLLGMALWQKGNVARHPSIAGLAKIGPPLEVVCTIEAELYRLYFWTRGEGLSKVVDMNESGARAAMQAIAVRWPSLVIEDAAAFE